MTKSFEQLDWNALKGFIVAAREGSFSKAAIHLGITQPTLSRQINQLELSLNVTLFERLSTGLQLTTPGQRLLEFAAPMGTSAQNVNLAVSGLAESLDGEVSISVSEIDALFRIPDLIDYISKHAPTIELTIHVSNQVSDIKRRDADIAIRSFRPEDGDLIARKLVEEPIWFYATPDYLSQFGETNVKTAIHNMQIIGFERNDELINHLLPLGWPVSPANFKLVTGFQPLQWQLVMRGHGLGFFPEAIGDKESRFRRVFEESGPVMTLPLWLVTHRELRTSPRIHKVFQLIGEWFEQQAH